MNGKKLGWAVVFACTSLAKDASSIADPNAQSCRGATLPSGIVHIPSGLINFPKQRHNNTMSAVTDEEEGLEEISLPSDVSSIYTTSNDGLAVTVHDREEPSVIEPEVSSKEQMDEAVLLNRCYLTIVHYLLTYPRWSLSLFLLLATMSLPMPHTMEDAVSKPWQALNQLATRESSLYLDCVKHSFDFAGRELNKTTANELHRVRALEESNREILSSFKIAVDQGVLMHTQNARRALHSYQQSRLLPITNSTDHCSALDRENLTQLVGHDYFQAEDAVNTIVDSLVTQSLSSAQSLASYAVDRSSYDYYYFVGLKINATLGLLQNISAPSVDLALDTDVLDRVKLLLKAILDALRDAHVRIELLRRRMVEFYLSLEDFYVNYVDVFDRLKLASAFVRDFLPNSIPLPGYLDLTGIPLPDAITPPAFQLVEFGTQLPDIDDLLSDYLKKLAELLLELVTELAEEASDQLRYALEELYELIQELLTLEDYDPPKYLGSHNDIGGIDAELAVLDGKSKESQHSIAAALDGLQTVPFGSVVFEGRVPDASSAGNVTGGEARNFGYLEPRFPSVTIPRLIYAFFAFLFTYQFVIEGAVQCVRFYTLKKKYERNAMPELPEVSYVAKNEDQDAKTSTMNILQVALFKHFMTPWMAVGLVLFPFAVIGTTVWFPHVKANCVDSSRGTIVARNIMTPLLVNKANAAGNAYHIQAEFQCRKRQRLICEEMYAKSDQTQRKHDFELASAKSDFEKYSDIARILGGCLDVNMLDDSLNESCCGLEGYTNCTGPGDPLTCPIDISSDRAKAYRPLSEYLFQPEFQINASDVSLQDAHFNCTVLEGICDISPCDGVDSDLIEEMAIAADCRAEVFLLKCCILVLVALYHAIAMNLYTSLIFSGIKHVAWRRLKPQGIMMRTHVNENGELVKGNDLTDRMRRITKAMKHFERIGRLQLYLGAFFAVFWIASFFVLRHVLRDFS